MARGGRKVVAGAARIDHERSKLEEEDGSESSSEPSPARKKGRRALRRDGLKTGSGKKRLALELDS